jgi:hypothetical protein
VKHASEARISVLAQYPAQKNRTQTVRHTPATAEPAPSDISLSNIAGSSTARRGCRRSDPSTFAAWLRQKMLVAVVTGSARSQENVRKACLIRYSSD